MTRFTFEELKAACGKAEANVLQKALGRLGIDAPSGADAEALLAMIQQQDRQQEGQVQVRSARAYPTGFVELTNGARVYKRGKEVWARRRVVVHVASVCVVWPLDTEPDVPQTLIKWSAGNDILVFESCETVMQKIREALE
jgi:hypothetical protein